jgi:hypothetical protein
MEINTKTLAVALRAAISKRTADIEKMEIIIEDDDPIFQWRLLLAAIEDGTPVNLVTTN